MLQISPGNKTSFKVQSEKQKIGSHMIILTGFKINNIGGE
jgi:hypothetical protein